jgi:hypothetical protein
MLGTALSHAPPFAAAAAVSLAVLSGSEFLVGVSLMLGGAMLTIYVYTLHQALQQLVDTSREEHIVLHRQLEFLISCFENYTDVSKLHNDLDELTKRYNLAVDQLSFHEKRLTAAEKKKLVNELSAQLRAKDARIAELEEDKKN